MTAMNASRPPHWTKMILALPGLMVQAPLPVLAADQEPLTLASFGAVGDGRTDDTQAVQKAFGEAAGRCLDGEGRAYRVRGTLSVATDFCLGNTRLRQDVQEFDTEPWIKGSCPVETNPAALFDCGDPALPERIPAELESYLYTRTLLIRPDAGKTPLAVTLRNVSVDRGTAPASGARSDAAGIWIENANHLELEDVKITGGGKGFGLIITNSSNVVVRRLWLHDLVWAPYAGDAPLVLAKVRQVGWNSVPIREFRRAGDRGAQWSGFRGMRVQEQLSCLMIVGSNNVLLDSVRIDGCRARFEEGDIPWQADGIGIGQSTSNVRIIGATIADTWEGVDVVGGGLGVVNVTISNTEVSNSFGYGIKVGYNSQQISLIDSMISRAGLAAVVLHGPVKNALLRRVAIEDVGRVNLAGSNQTPWSQQRAGVLIQAGGSAETANFYPEEVTLDAVSIQGHGECRFGLLNATPVALSRADIHASGCDEPAMYRSE